MMVILTTRLFSVIQTYMNTIMYVWLGCQILDCYEGYLNLVTAVNLICYQSISNYSTSTILDRCVHIVMVYFTRLGDITKIKFHHLEGT